MSNETSGDEQAVGGGDHVDRRDDEAGVRSALEPGEPLIRVENLRMKFGRSMILDDISLDIAKGQTLVVIGESGCGKTVFLKTLVGLVRPTGGRVMFDGHDFARLNEQKLAAQRLRFGFVFQLAALFDSLDVFENVAFALREHTSLSERELRDAVRERLTEVGLNPDIMHRKPAELSGGMRKRVGLARAVALGPEVMLYDEPTTGLDPIMSDVINQLIIRTRQARPVTSVVVTHDMHSALKIADRIVMFYPRARLEEGDSQILYDGSPEDIEDADDPRVRQFVRGEAGDRLAEMMA